MKTEKAIAEYPRKMLLKVCFMLLFFTITNAELEARIRSPQSERLHTDEIISSFGYPVESHYVTTQDGYILRMFRISHGLQNSTGPKTPVMLQHGLMDSSDGWVINFPHQSPAFALADAGYDVWIGNVRGNKYSRNHTTLNPDTDDRFWEYSWDQHAAYDAPAMIDTILAKTGYQQLYYVGHSMGTVMAFALLSTRPEYNDNIKKFVALAPPLYLQHVKSPIGLLAPLAPLLPVLMNLLGTGEFFPSNKLMGFLGKACAIPAAVQENEENIVQALCNNFYFLNFGYNKKEFNATRMDIYFQHYPSGTSSRTVAHFAKQINTGKFVSWDWGPTKNQQIFNQPRPIEYNVNKITTPVVIFWGKNDYLATPPDVAILVPKLKSLVASYEMGKDFNHGDFLLAIHADTLVNPKIIDQLPKF